MIYFGYSLTILWSKYFFSLLTILYQKYLFVHIKMSYYFFNRQQSLQKAKYRYHNCGGKEKSAQYYIKNKEVLKQMQ